MGKLAHFFLDVDMRCSHEGLWAMLKKKKIKVAEDEFVVFLNRKRSTIKMFCGGKDALMHYRKDGRVIDPGVIRYLPKYCGGKELDVDGAVKEYLQELMKRRGYRVKDED